MYICRYIIILYRITDVFPSTSIPSLMADRHSSPHIQVTQPILDEDFVHVKPLYLLIDFIHK